MKECIWTLKNEDVCLPFLAVKSINMQRQSNRMICKILLSNMITNQIAAAPTKTINLIIYKYASPMRLSKIMVILKMKKAWWLWVIWVKIHKMKFLKNKIKPTIIYCQKSGEQKKTVLTLILYRKETLKIWKIMCSALVWRKMSEKKT